jgi:hypothetical protein
LPIQAGNVSVSETTTMMIAIASVAFAYSEMPHAALAA